MSLTVRSLDDEAMILRHLRSQLNCDESPAALRTAIVAEHIRALICAPFTSNPYERPIHTGRLLGALARNTRFLAASTGNFEGLEETFAFTREQLVLSGDIIHAGGGYWIPCPARAVRVSPEFVYLLGGAPLAHFARQICEPIVAVGPSRHIKSCNPVAFPTLTLSQWLENGETLAEWSERTLTCAAAELTPQANIEDHSLEIYAPDMYRALRRPGFWATAREFQEAKPSLRLFRPKVAPQWAFDRPDYLGVFRQGVNGAQLIKAVRIAHDIARRLQFGFDLKYQTPRTLILRAIGNMFRLDVKYPPFPYPEARVLGLGWREPDQPDALHFTPPALAALQRAAQLLGMRLHHA